MKTITRRTWMLAFLLLPAAVSVFAQGSSFSDANVDYAFDIPDTRWKMTVKPSAANPNVEFVFAERNDGHLEIRSVAAAKDAMMADVIRNEELKLQFLPGFVAGREENFGGTLRGTIFNFEFVRAGRPMSGRYYFLKAPDGSIYVLRFTGYTDKLKTLRNQTDSIARSFNIRKR